MKLRNKKTGEIREFGYLQSDYVKNLVLTVDNGKDSVEMFPYDSLSDLNEEWEDYKPKEPIIKDEKIRKMVRYWAEYNQTESVEVYNLIYDHGGICIENALVRFYDPRLRTNLDVWFKTEAPTFEDVRDYSIAELCGEEE